jgi:DNA-directed RNA polymerase
MSAIERQIKLEADARYEGMLRCARNREYQLATDLKPVRDLLANSLESLWEVILQHQMELEREAARELLGKIDRSVVKPATMTTPYGVTRGTIYEKLLERT